jgi:steroid 5-alpha reductase family enzyme
MDDFNHFYITMIVTLFGCIIGFKYYIWFFSIGYGLSITLIGIYLIIIFHKYLSIYSIISCSLFIIYGIRLASYLAIREIKSSYNIKMKGEIKTNDSIPLIFRIFIWIASSFLYAIMTCPITFRLIINKRNQNSNKDYSLLYLITLIISSLGLLIETCADYQKDSAKKINPNRFVDTGLYKIVRCPNYFGEIVFWTGVFISGFNIYNSYQFWIFSILGYIGIIYVMFSGARRLEIRQNKTYGNDAEYQNYFNNTPMIFPCIPLYSVERFTWFVA